MDVEHEPPDKATEAFDAVRDKLAGLTRAVDSMAGEWKTLAIPDYSPTLEKMAAALKANNELLDDLTEMPALQMGPKELGAAIIIAGKDARADDHAAIANATNALREYELNIASVVASARSAEQQDKWLLRAGLIGATVGTFLAFALPTIAISFAPESWHWPEKRAANILDRDVWEAGERLLSVADRREWEALTLVANATRASRQEVIKCATLAKSTKKSLRCQISIAP